jgi:hypothetical protein
MVRAPPAHQFERRLQALPFGLVAVEDLGDQLIAREPCLATGTLDVHVRERPDAKGSDEEAGGQAPGSEGAAAP